MQGLEWPSHGGKLNLKRTLWAQLKKAVSKRCHHSLLDLENFNKVEWDNIFK